MQPRYWKSIRLLIFIILLPLFLLLALITALQPSPTPVRAAGSFGDITERPSAHIPLQQNRACDGTETGLCKDGTCTHVEEEDQACIFNRGLDTWYGLEGPPPTPVSEPIETDTETAAEEPQSAVVSGISNLITNGNFEFSFYPVPELGFEPPDVGQVPLGWNWYKNRTYGKYKIDNNQRLGIVCGGDYWPEEPPGEEEEESIFAPVPGIGQRIGEDGEILTDASEGNNSNALELHMQSTDQIDARLGVYQTVDVTPGQYYLFSMSGTLQIQSGATTDQPDDPQAPIEAPNNTIELYFDHTGNTNWQAIPHKNWTILPWEEQKLEFRVSEDDSDIAAIEDYYTYVRAQSNKMTIFITFWRKWANWRTGIASIDCVALLPVDVSRLPSEVIQAAATGAQVPIQPAIMTEESEAAPSQTGQQPAGAQSSPEVALPVTGQKETNQETASPQANQEITPSQADQQAAPQQSSQEEPLSQNKEESILPQTGQETAPWQNSQEATVSQKNQEAITASGDQEATAPQFDRPEAPAPAAETTSPWQYLEQQDDLVLIIAAALAISICLAGVGIWHMGRK